ncbi:MAG TPA: phosphate/phosphite/phosphonate ABC transporter substrate-binding protein [Anaerolineales bacterium]|nr:phosphate/phosphite/phosphonate ABC transporter substrate-binding protein [Anaerolineales bacterium]
MKNKKLFLIIALVGLLALALSACGGEADLGTEENPIVWVLVPSAEAEGVLTGFETFTDMVFDETGLVIEPFVATNNAAAIEALCSGDAHMGALNTFSTVVAIQRGCVDVELVAVRFGSPFYNGQLLAGADSGITSVADFGGKTFCRDDEFSTSSWIIPMLEMRATGINVEDEVTTVDTGGHPQNVIGILEGQCEVGASYVDARTAVEEDYPDVMDRVNVVGISADIPNDGVQYQAEFSQELRDQLNPALISVAGSEAGAEALSSAYSWDGLEAHDNSFYDPFLQVLEASGFDIGTLVE